MSDAKSRQNQSNWTVADAKARQDRLVQFLRATPQPSAGLVEDALAFVSALHAITGKPEGSVSKEFVDELYE